MRKILGLTVAAVLVMGLVGGGTWAYFSDTESVTTNILSAGTIDLSSDVATAELTAANFAPGDVLGTGNITLTNDGSLDANVLNITVTFVENDNAYSTGNATDMTANETAAMLQVTTLTYGGTDILAANVSDDNSNGWKDLDDVANADLSSLAGINASASKDFIITIQARGSEMTNSYQNDGVDVTFTFELTQN